jgi:hypothetical protein
VQARLKPLLENPGAVASETPTRSALLASSAVVSVSTATMPASTASAIQEYLDLPDAPPKPKAPTEATPTTLVAARAAESVKPFD